MHEVMKESEKNRRNEELLLKSVSGNKQTAEKEATNKAIRDKWLDTPFLITPSEPKRKNQYLVEIVGLDVEPHIFQHVSRPTKHQWGWGEMEITILDFIGDNFNQKLDKLINKKKGFFKSKNWSLEVKINETDPSGKIIETNIYNTELLKIEYGDLSYSMSDLSDLKLILRVKSVLNKTN